MLRRSSSGVDVTLAGFQTGLRKARSFDEGHLHSFRSQPLPRTLRERSAESLNDLRSVLDAAALQPIPERSVLPAPVVPGPAASRKSLVLICMLATIDGMDIQLLPASFKALESDLGLKPTSLALLAVCQGYAMCISGPLWGSVVDQGFPRRWLLSAGCFSWGLLTLMLALVHTFRAMVVLRTLNGLALGLLTPVIQSFIAEMSQRDEIGFSFGCLDFCHMAIGQTLALVTISSVADVQIFGMAGWRFAFIVVAIMSMSMAAPLALCLEEKPRVWQPEKVGFLSEFRKFALYLETPTFVVLLVQGVFGTIPGSAMAFTTMYFQYIGTGTLSGLVAAFKIVGTGIGSVLGGVIGDRLAGTCPKHGRALTAQISVALSIPVAASIFLLVPASPHAWPLHVGLLFLLGLLHWCSSACNRPMLVELVAPDSIGSVVAWQNCIEHLSGFILGPVGVAALSELCFDYQPTHKAVWSMSSWERDVNAAALGQSLALCTVLPWTVCFFMYGILHSTYPKEMATRVRQQFLQSLPQIPGASFAAQPPRGAPSRMGLSQAARGRGRG